MNWNRIRVLIDNDSYMWPVKASKNTVAFFFVNETRTAASGQTDPTQLLYNGFNGGTNFSKNSSRIIYFGRENTLANNKSNGIMIAGIRIGTAYSNPDGSMSDFFFL